MYLMQDVIINGKCFRVHKIGTYKECNKESELMKSKGYETHMEIKQDSISIPPNNIKNISDIKYILYVSYTKKINMKDYISINKNNTKFIKNINFEIKKEKFDEFSEKLHKLIDEYEVKSNMR